MHLSINAHSNCGAIRRFLHSILKVILRKSRVLELRPDQGLKPLAQSPVSVLLKKKVGGPQSTLQSKGSPPPQGSPPHPTHARKSGHCQCVLHNSLNLKP